MRDKTDDEDEPIVVVSPTLEDIAHGSSGKITGGELDIVGNTYPVGVSLTPYWKSDDFFWEAYGLIKAPVVASDSGRDWTALPMISGNESQSVKAVKLTFGEKGKVLVRVAMTPDMAEDMAAALIKGVVTFSTDRAEGILDTVMQAVKEAIEEAAAAKVRWEEFEKNIKPIHPPEM